MNQCSLTLRRFQLPFWPLRLQWVPFWHCSTARWGQHRCYLAIVSDPLDTEPSPLGCLGEVKSVLGEMDGREGLVAGDCETGPRAFALWLRSQVQGVPFSFGNVVAFLLTDLFPPSLPPSLCVFFDSTREFSPPCSYSSPISHALH